VIARGLGVLLIALGAGVVAQTIAHGGHGLAYGYFFGPLLILAGALRLYLSFRMRT
jgi:hypothetical protein